MASGAIATDSSLMDIFMTCIAFAFSFLKNQCDMALPAVDLSMLARKRQFGLVVVKRIDLFIQLPTL
jgi:hypothetical protein